MQTLPGVKAKIPGGEGTLNVEVIGMLVGGGGGTLNVEMMGVLVGNLFGKP